ncbi:Protein phosphatase 1 regulatory subunit 12B, partial [Pseudolycoriella hygida]
SKLIRLIKFVYRRRATCKGILRVNIELSLQLSPRSRRNFNMSFTDTRNNSAMYKRAEQLKRWEESDTNREPAEPKNLSSRKIKFSSGCVFLAACMSADRAEVLRLLDNGADIDTVNVDGLTALH